MAQYMLSVHHDDMATYDAPDPEFMARVGPQVDAFNTKITDAGQWVFGGGLESPTTATVVRTEDGATTMSDGPFIEAKEFLGGFWVIDVADLDVALALAAEASAACEGPVEVRPFQSEPEA